MNRNEIRLFDDSVIKLTIKQGLEKERFVVQNNENSWTYNNTEIDIRDWDTIYTLPGSLSSGELAYTRDTSRIFVGNIYDSKADAEGHQQTLGGVLAGNKYLGYVDSRNKNIETFSGEDGTELSGKPLNLNGVGGLLEENSIYRSYNWPENSSDEEINRTEDGRWQKIPYYNKKYDAYDGDYMYDIYRNAIILFDHNIKPYDGDLEAVGTLNGKRKTPLIPRYNGTIETEREEEQKLSYNYTSDMYGDGYVLFYNVIPDGKTLTFESKSYGPDGKWNNVNENEPNYSYNILKINKLKVENISDIFKPELEGGDGTSSDFTTDGNVITLHSNIKDAIDAARKVISPDFTSIFSNNSAEPGIVANDNCFILGLNPYTEIRDDITREFRIKNSNTVQTGLLVSEVKNNMDIVKRAFDSTSSSVQIKTEVIPDYVSRTDVEMMIDNSTPGGSPIINSNILFPRLKDFIKVLNITTLEALYTECNGDFEEFANNLIAEIMYHELHDLIFANEDKIYIRKTLDDESLEQILGVKWKDTYGTINFTPDGEAQSTTLDAYIKKRLELPDNEQEINYYLYIKNNTSNSNGYITISGPDLNEEIKLYSNGSHIMVPLENNSNYIISGTDSNSIYYIPVSSKNGTINDDTEVHPEEE